MVAGINSVWSVLAVSSRFVVRSAFSWIGLVVVHACSALLCSGWCLPWLDWLSPLCFSLSLSLSPSSLSLSVCLCLTDYFFVVFLDYPVRPRDLTKLPPKLRANSLRPSKRQDRHDQRRDDRQDSQESRVKRQTGSTNTLLVDCCMPASTRSALG